VIKLVVKVESIPSLSRSRLPSSARRKRPAVAVAVASVPRCRGPYWSRGMGGFD